jgi:hypothetical protein
MVLQCATGGRLHALAQVKNAAFLKGRNPADARRSTNKVFVQCPTHCRLWLPKIRRLIPDIGMVGP